MPTPKCMRSWDPLALPTAHAAPSSATAVKSAHGMGSITPSIEWIQLICHWRAAPSGTCLLTQVGVKDSLKSGIDLLAYTQWPKLVWKRFTEDQHRLSGRYPVLQASVKEVHLWEAHNQCCIPSDPHRRQRGSLESGTKVHSATLPNVGPMVGFEPRCLSTAARCATQRPKVGGKTARQID